jgi:hypothetical protein
MGVKLAAREIRTLYVYVKIIYDIKNTIDLSTSNHASHGFQQLFRNWFDSFSAGGLVAKPHESQQILPQ